MKTRFSPSPTGYMHLGNVRTALFSALLAHRLGGKFLLRIEDTDKVRSKPEFAAMLQEDLRWLGLIWDEGPYYQSERQKTYAEYYDYLEQQNMVYACFCSDEQLALARKVQLASGQPPRYAGTCRTLDKSIIAEKLASGIKPTLRFKVPSDQEVHFTDLVKGLQRFRTDDIGDFIIRRSDGSASFFFCNAIDDAVMGITHALRGEDHLTNTPRQILVLTALGLPVPKYGHIALIIGDDSAPLSKRNGSKSLKELREEGYLPVAINNYLGRLGHYYPKNQLMDFHLLANYFSLEHLGTTPAHFDRQQLYYWQKVAVSQLNENDFWQWLDEPVWQLVPAEKRAIFIRLIKPNTVFPKEALRLATALFTPFEVTESHRQQFQALVNPVFIQSLMTLIKIYDADYTLVVKALQQQQGLKGKALFAPLRFSLTGEQEGPELAGIFALLGKKGLLNRLEQVLQLL